MRLSLEWVDSEGYNPAMDRVCTQCGNSEAVTKFPARGLQCSRCVIKKSNDTRKARVEAGTYHRHEFAISLGLTASEYATIQQRPCGICGREATADKPNTAYQNRGTKRVVGPACRKCVTALGMFDHDRDRLIAALAYVAG